MSIAERNNRNWRWLAGRSEIEDIPSVLSIVETILAMSIAVVVAAILNLWTYLLVASTIAPLLLLRTERSTELGIRWFKLLTSWGRKLPRRPSLPGGIVTFLDYQKHKARDSGLLLLYALYYIEIPGASLIAKCSATACCVLRHPLESIAAIPKNWKRVCFETDLSKPLEIVPGIPLSDVPIEMAAERNPRRPGTRIRYPNLLSWCPERVGILLIVPAFVLQVIVVLFSGMLFGLPAELCENIGKFGLLLGLLASYIVAFWYRWSVKSTAIVWLPLLYMAFDITPRGWTAGRRLETICTSGTAKVVRGYALVMFVLLLMKFIGQVVWYKAIREGLHEYEWLQIIAPIVEPINVPAWQVLSLLNAIGAWLLYFFADWQIRKRQYNEGLSDETVSTSLSTAFLVRWSIAVYTAICTLYSLYIIVKNSHPPEWRFTFFPWQ